MPTCCSCNQWKATREGRGHSCSKRCRSTRSGFHISHMVNVGSTALSATVLLLWVAKWPHVLLWCVLWFSVGWSIGWVFLIIIIFMFYFVFVLRRFIWMLTKVPGDVGMCFRQSQCCKKCSVQVSCSTQTCKCFCWLSSRRIQQLSYSWELYPLCFPLLLEEGVLFTTIAVNLNNDICMLKLLLPCFYFWNC